MLSKYKFYSEARLGALGKKLYWVNPNILTVLGIVPPVLFFFCMQSGKAALALVMLFLTAIDLLDGVIARANNKETAFGAFLDSSVDRVGDFFIIAGLYAGGLVRLEIAAALLLASFLISYVHSRAELASGGKVKFNYGLMERTERIVFVFLTLLLYILFPHAAALGLQLPELLILLLAILSIYTVFQRVWYAYKKL